jgi:hypothetical protein
MIVEGRLPFVVGDSVWMMEGKGEAGGDLVFLSALFSPQAKFIFR